MGTSLRRECERKAEPLSFPSAAQITLLTSSLCRFLLAEMNGGRPRVETFKVSIWPSVLPLLYLLILQQRHPLSSPKSFLSRIIPLFRISCRRRHRRPSCPEVSDTCSLPLPSIVPSPAMPAAIVLRGAGGRLAGWLPCQQTLSLTARFDADKVMRTKVMPRVSKRPQC